MYTLIKPTKRQIYRFIAIQRRRSFSYREVGASAKVPPAGYTVDHNRIHLGQGAETFEQAKAAICRWEMFNFEWVQLYRPNASLEVGVTVAVLARATGIWSLNACRLVYLIDDGGEIEKFGFAYGTLPDHAERGEERFSVEWHHKDNSVWYDILAFSRPNQLLSKIGYPYVRQIQKRFARDSLQAMARAVNSVKR